MITQEQRKYFEKLIFRTNQEVLEVMKRIPEGELFSRNEKKILKFPKKEDNKDLKGLWKEKDETNTK